MADDDLLRELNEVRAENARLRELLGFDSRRAESHAQSWEPALFQDAPALPRVDGRSSTDEKLELFQRLFAGRTDVFALRWQNETTGRSGWSPAVRGGWSKASKARREYLPLTNEVLAAHLAGRSTVGIYPLLHGDACNLLVCDFDDTTWSVDALAYLDACVAAGVPAALERSRSGDGAHVWIFFTAGVPAATARSLGAALLREAMTARGELDLASYDRFFPAQDYTPRGSFGNLIALPLHGERAQQGTTVFLDPTGLEPWPDQWAFLSSVKRLTPGAVASVADTMRPIDAGPDATTLRAGLSVGGPATPGDPCPLGGDARGRTQRPAAGVGRVVQAPGVDSQSRLLREATHAVLDLGDAAVHPRLRRRSRMASPASWARQPGKRPRHPSRQLARNHRRACCPRTRGLLFRGRADRHPARGRRRARHARSRSAGGATGRRQDSHGVRADRSAPDTHTCDR